MFTETWHESEHLDHTHRPNRFAVIPTAVRLEADAQYTGRGVTIAFLDSGFYPHPDLTQPVNRIVAYQDITRPGAALRAAASPEGTAWHGTQTSVAAAGNGFLSRGLYRGLASDAQVMLIKVSEEGRIREENVARGIRRVIELRDKFNIRILNISLGGDADIPWRNSQVDQAAEAAVAAGIVVIAAAGNAGCTDDHLTTPPANAPSVIAVGGYNDHNQLNQTSPSLYCSSFGVTADGLVKPEIIAPAIWTAAPILPGTSAWQQAAALDQISNTPDYQLGELVRKLAAEAGLTASLADEEPEVIRAAVMTSLQHSKFISAHYQHVDGTSFAAPIVASVVAQMLEVRPALTPAAVRHILIATADRLAGQPLLRQGYGVINARRAVAQALCETHADSLHHLGAPRIAGNILVFSHHDDLAHSVALAADFNNWDITRNKFTRQTDGIWRVELPLLPPGRYCYKFVINGAQWIDDPGNGMKEPDQYGGFNSLLHLL